MSENTKFFILLALLIASIALLVYLNDGANQLLLKH